MPEPKLAPIASRDEVVDNRRAYLTRPGKPASQTKKWQARHDLERHLAETERLKVLVEFLARPIHSHGGLDPDPDIVTAYNLAVEAALHEIRRAAFAE